MFEWFSALLVLAVILLIWLYKRARAELGYLKSDKQSILTRHGKSMEQFIPFIKDYPYDKSNFRFIGTPVDGIQFEPDKIVFIEFKTGDSRMTAKQTGIKDLILNNKVEFEEIRIS